MDLCLAGYKRNRRGMTMGDLIIHKGRRMTESETRMVVNYGIEHGYELASQIPDEVADKICDPQCTEFDKYDDTPEFYSLDYIREMLRKVQNCYYVEWDADDIMDKLEQEL